MSTAIELRKGDVAEGAYAFNQHLTLPGEKAARVLNPDGVQANNYIKIALVYLQVFLL